MGNQLRGAGAGTGTSNATPLEQLSSIRLSEEEIRSYEDACKNDQNVSTFDAELKDRTIKAIGALANGEDHQPLSFSLDLLKEMTNFFLETDQQVVENILSVKKDIWNNPELLSLVDDYFKTSLQTLDFCNALEKCLANARGKQTILCAGLQRLAKAAITPGPGRDEYKKAMEDLRAFRSIETHFTEDMLGLFETVFRHHLQMLQKLQEQRIQLDKKLKRVRSWRKTVNIIFAATFVTVLICSIVAAALTAPPVVTAMLAALGAVAAWAPTEKWFNQLSKGFEDAVQEQKEVVNSMEAGTLVAIRDLDNIKILVEKLEMEMSNFLGQIDDSLAFEEENSLHLVIQDIQNKVSIFNRNVDELEKFVDSCSRNIHKAREVVLQRIVKAPRQE